MEKHKPYRCNVCGKRYKNLNGLKYHKSHSINCDTDPRSDTDPMTGGAVMSQGGGPGDSLIHIGEEMVR